MSGYSLRFWYRKLARGGRGNLKVVSLPLLLETSVRRPKAGPGHCICNMHRVVSLYRKELVRTLTCTAL
jgi:hypothetical protein